MIHLFAEGGADRLRRQQPRLQFRYHGDDWFDSRRLQEDELRRRFSLGTLFLWLYWPSFNGALAGDDGNARHRAIINTLLSISASSLVSFMASRLLEGGSVRSVGIGKFNMVDIQNATLAGGVAMGCCANMLPQPWGALFIGMWAGLLSTFGFNKIQPFLEEKIGLKDTCGVHNLHGMPSLWGAFCSVVLAGISTHEQCLWCCRRHCD